MNQHIFSTYNSYNKKIFYFVFSAETEPEDDGKRTKRPKKFSNYRTAVSKQSSVFNQGQEVSDKKLLFQAINSARNSVPPTSTMTNNQDQLNVCNQFIIYIFSFRR